MKLENAYKMLLAQAKNLMQQGKVAEYLQVLVAINSMHQQKLQLLSAPQMNK
jgi:hypothetical protein